MRNYILIVWLNDQERIDLEAWDACRALLSFLHLPRALTKQELLSHAPETQNTQNPSNQMGGITNSPLLRVLKCDCSNQSVLPCLCLEQVDVFICRSFKLIAIGCQIWRVRNLNWANIQVLWTQTIFCQIHFQHLDWGVYMVDKAQIWARPEFPRDGFRLFWLFRCYSSHHLPIAFWRLISLSCLKLIAGIIMMVMVATWRSFNPGILMVIPSPPFVYLAAWPI